MMGTSVWERRGRRPAPAARASAWRRSGWWGGPRPHRLVGPGGARQPRGAGGRRPGGALLHLCRGGRGVVEARVVARRARRRARRPRPRPTAQLVAVPTGAHRGGQERGNDRPPVPHGVPCRVGRRGRAVRAEGGDPARPVPPRRLRGHGPRAPRLAGAGARRPARGSARGRAPGCRGAPLRECRARHGSSGPRGLEALGGRRHRRDPVHLRLRGGPQGGDALAQQHDRLRGGLRLRPAPGMRRRHLHALAPWAMPRASSTASSCRSSPAAPPSCATRPMAPRWRGSSRSTGRPAGCLCPPSSTSSCASARATGHASIGSGSCAAAGHRCPGASSSGPAPWGCACTRCTARPSTPLTRSPPSRTPTSGC